MKKNQYDVIYLQFSLDGINIEKMLFSIIQFIFCFWHVRIKPYLESISIKTIFEYLIIRTIYSFYR